MRYVIVDIKDGDMFSKEFDDKTEAIRQAEEDFEALTSADKKHRSDFYVLESINPDTEAENHFDGKEIRRWL